MLCLIRLMRLKFSLRSDFQGSQSYARHHAHLFQYFDDNIWLAIVFCGERVISLVAILLSYRRIRDITYSFY